MLFKKEVERIIRRYEELNGHPATYTHDMIRSKGEITTLSELVTSSKHHKGFKVLLDNHQLDNTFEALVVRFKSQFKPDIVAAAQFRLAEDFPLRKIIKFKSKLFVHSMVFHMGFAPGFALSSKPTVLKGSIMSGLCYYIIISFRQNNCTLPT